MKCSSACLCHVSELEHRESADCEEEEKKGGDREEERKISNRDEILRMEDLEPSAPCDTHSNMEQYVLYMYSFMHISIQPS